MISPIPQPGEQVVIAKPALQTIFTSLQEAEYTLIGPTWQEEAIVYEEISSFEDMPYGWMDEQEPGKYRLRKQEEPQYFSYVVGPNSWKRYLFPPQIKLFSTKNGKDGFEIQPEPVAAPRYAFIGARACELAAITVQDRIFLDGPYPEPHYQARRENAFILAVNCTNPANTCFCASLGTGPRCATDFDLALTELRDSFLIEIGSPLGARILADTEWELAGALEVKRAQQLLTEAENGMGRTLGTADLPELLLENLDHPRWDEVAERCLACTNCTMVCPTCFCSDVHDVSDLTGENTERVRIWDSCFNPDFSYVHGGNIRPNVRARYRQWLTHKLASWSGQFDTLGCVGCGRCITWCPVGIDLTEEIAAIRGEN